MTCSSLPLGPETAHGALVLVTDYMAVIAGETVLITADTATDPVAVRAVFLAARGAGAKVALVTVPQLPFQGGLADPFVPPPLTAAALSCDVWIDLTFPYLAGAHVHDEAMRAGRARYLLGGDMGAGGLARLFGAVDLDQYFTILRPFEDALANSAGRQVRVTDPIGTDVTFTTDKPALRKPRRAETPGTYLVPGSCTMFPQLESVQGTVCFSAVFHEFFTPLERPLTLKVDGKIREVAGGGGARLVLERSLRRAGGGEYGYLIHFTYGMNPAARTTDHSFIEDSRVIGNNAVGMGLPWWMPGGGENHPDAVVTEQSIWVDGVPVIRDGLPVEPSLVEAAQGLAPLLRSGS
ncbi:hypothetical protein [Roseomonas chloroacetimidivorans]|uniref:hypothetical protein n=1 Tax=Roseomonas chloroacetimidivorans TaxID=1766656 RepID=UPI003C741EF6